MNKHETDAVSLTVGSVFLAFVVLWFVTRTVHIDAVSIGWFFAGLLVLVGALGLAAALRSRS